MLALITEILVFLAIAALIGLALGYLFWGWGQRARVDAARADAAALVRTSVDGGGLRSQLDACTEARGKLEREMLELRQELEVAEARAKDADGAGQVENSSGNDDLRSQLEACRDARSDLERELQDLRKELGAANARAEAARPGNEASSSALAAAPPVQVSEDPAPLTVTGGSTLDREDAFEAVEDEGPAPHEPEPAADAGPPPPPPDSLLTERPDEVDDLKRIKGVGPVMESVLNDKGVYLFRQVANFSAQDVAWVNEAIEAFPGRIERDDWVGQAQSLYREKYGRRHDEE